jgi:cellulose synthase/poly-beta-1,6-N-acetylglucosamine synthase-like glycosyltransferase
VYQVFCIIVGLFGKPIIFPECAPKHYAVLIAARNEENVIAELINSIKAQKYDEKHLDILVCADNCTDKTAEVARKHGAKVVERFNKHEVGKGYALSYLFDNTDNLDQYDAFFVFDADNVLDENYITEMNKVFSAGFEVVTSYRNSKNLGSNWVSSGSAIWFARESSQINFTRMKIGGSCQVGGTGFMFSKRIMQRNKGWKHHLLTEDIEFSMDCVLNGDKIGYCGSAIYYDEQPVLFSTSWQQRLRWAKGMMQVFREYGSSLVKHAVRSGELSALDLMMFTFPWAAVYLFRLFIGMLFALWGLVSFYSQAMQLISMLTTALLSIFALMVLAGITVLSQRSKMRATNKQLLSYVISFPIYVGSYMLISMLAIFSKVEWEPIPHGDKAHLG